MNTYTRRQYLGGLGIGGAAVLAGCVSAPTSPAAGQPAVDDVTEITPAKPVDVDRVAADPTAIPGPITRSQPADVDVSLEALEVVAEIEDGVTFNYMTFGGQVPGPMVRVREGDRVTLTLTNSTENATLHNVDAHAIYGPGGGAEATTVAPGESATIEFTATYPGAFVYHCAVANVDYHISSGMYGMFLVEPKDGLPAVDHELYFGQNEVYTTHPAGTRGHHQFDFDALAAEEPTYTLINGEKYAITDARHGPVEVVVGDTARVFFVTGGPNRTSSFHPIGNVWTHVWAEGALASEPEQYVQTKPVAPGSALVATMDFPVPGDVKLVDHALSRVTRGGALAVVRVTGPENPEVFDADPEQ